jgi:hypothetical protein
MRLKLATLYVNILDAAEERSVDPGSPLTIEHSAVLAARHASSSHKLSCRRTSAGVRQLTAALAHRLRCRRHLSGRCHHVFVFASNVCAVPDFGDGLLARAQDHRGLYEDEFPLLVAGGVIDDLA